MDSSPPAPGATPLDRLRALLRQHVEARGLGVVADGPASVPLAFYSGSTAAPPDLAVESLPGPDLPDDLSSAQKRKALNDDQRQRWQQGDRVLVEVYLQRYPFLRCAVEAFHLVYGEFLLREQLGEAPAVAEYTQRFPDDKEALEGQGPIAIHALEHLGTSDRGVIMFRKLLKRGIEAGRDAIVQALKDMSTPVSGKESISQVAAISAADETIGDLIAEVCFAKNTAVEAGEWVANQAVQLFGGLGYMTESEVERQYRDMRILGIGGGTSEILTELAAKRLGYNG